MCVMIGQLPLSEGHALAQLVSACLVAYLLSIDGPCGSCLSKEDLLPCHYSF